MRTWTTPSSCTATQGRVAAVARGALRPRSDLASALQPLTPLALEFRGRGELLSLVRAEAHAPAFAIHGTRLYSVLYLNELLIRLTAAHDPLPALFERYQATLAALAAGDPEEPALRGFECRLLEEIGLGLHLAAEAESGRPIVPDRDYVYVPELGVLPRASGNPGCRVQGATLQALAGAGPHTALTLREAKRLMRHVLDHHLEGRPLAARELFAAAATRKS
jgi:DNA repair protein RecO (recombination protein O)